jgi:hypothetical protein
MLPALVSLIETNHLRMMATKKRESGLLKEAPLLSGGFLNILDGFLFD